jgi:hypothetical protein
MRVNRGDKVLEQLDLLEGLRWNANAGELARKSDLGRPRVATELEIVRVIASYFLINTLISRLERHL